MIPLPPSTRIYLACGATDMRKGFDGLAVLAQQVLEQSPHSGALFAFRGKRGDLVNCSGMMAKAYACSPSGWTVVGSSGR